MAFSELLSWWPIVVVPVLLVLAARDLIVLGRSKRALVEHLRPKSSDWPSWRRIANGDEILEALVSDDPDDRVLAERVDIGSIGILRWFFLLITIGSIAEVTDLIHAGWLWATLSFVFLLWWFVSFRLEPRHRALNLELVRYWHEAVPDEWFQAASGARFSLDPVAQTVQAARGSEYAEVRERAELARRLSRQVGLLLWPLLLVMLGAFAIDIAWR